MEEYQLLHLPMYVSTSIHCMYIMHKIILSNSLYTCLIISMIVTCLCEENMFAVYLPVSNKGYNDRDCMLHAHKL